MMLCPLVAMNVGPPRCLQARRTECGLRRSESGETLSSGHLNKQRLINSLGAEINENTGLSIAQGPPYRTKFRRCYREASAVPRPACTDPDGGPAQSRRSRVDATPGEPWHTPTACGFSIVLGGDVLGVIEVCSQAVWHPDPDLVTRMAAPVSFSRWLGCGFA